MFRTFLLPLIALLGFVFAGWTVSRSHQPVPVAPPIALPVEAPFATYVAGSGLVEPSTENIAIGTPVGGIVVAAPATVGAEVKAGDLLFRLDDRALRAQLAVQEASALTAKGGLAESDALLADAQQQLAKFQGLSESHAISLDERDRRAAAVQVAIARRQQAEARIAEIAAQAQATRTQISLLEIRAPIDATVLQKKIRLGEFAATGVLATPLIQLGGTSMLHVRVDIDENDAWRVRATAEAMAYVRGNHALNTKLEFVRFEPYVVPKRSLTGDSNERVDTRVLQVIYAFKREALPVYVGQQMEIFISAPSNDSTIAQPQGTKP